MLLPETPDPSPMTPLLVPGTAEAPRIIGTATNYLTFVAALRARLTGELGLSYETLDALAGWGATYSTKILGAEPSVPKDGNGHRPTARSLGPLSFDVLLSLACVKIQFVEDAAALARLQKHRDFVPRKRPMRNRAGQDYIVRRDTREFMRQMGLASAVARREKLTPKRRSALARKAAKARWHKPRAA